MAQSPFREVRRCTPARLGRYRYLLEIALAEAPGSRLAVVLKNPSAASAERSDPTIGKAEAWARRRGFASLSVVNLFAWRSPHPEKLNALSYRKIVGPDNDRHISAAAAGANLIVAGWGNPNGIDPEKYERRIEEVCEILRPFRLHAVGAPTRAGHPRHALLWNGNPEAAPFSPNGAGRPDAG